MPVNCHPAEFRHLLSLGRRGAERLDLRDSDTLIDSRDSKAETEKESQTPVNQTSLAKSSRASLFRRDNWSKPGENSIFDVRGYLENHLEANWEDDPTENSMFTQSIRQTTLLEERTRIAQKV